MAFGFLRKLFGDTSDKEIKKIEPIVKSIEQLADKYHNMSDDQLKAMTPYFKEQLNSGKTLDDILPDAFAVCREAAMLALRENIEASEVSAKFFDEAMDKVKPKTVSDEEELIQYY